ncbi:MAG TPA: DUF1761 domain-containing protein [Candidatus Paceibacterota bacterium]|nr:DUF1761 domain-containing protein [Candidatus Paceibacterota bacterium]
MVINFFAVLVCAVLSLVIGFIWYGPLFGKKWMAMMGADKLSEEQKKEKMKGMWKLYLTQFLLVLFQMYVLSWYIGTLSDISSGVHTAFSVWIAFIIPTLASASMWSGDSKKVAWSKFLIQAGYNLVLFLICGHILGVWM